jgi:hypothetical protein
MAVTRKYYFLATVGAIALVPQIAQASCSGNACNAFSTIAVWNGSGKRVDTTFTNKETKEVRLKFCVTVDGKCNSFELTLPPSGKVTKNVPVPGILGAPPKFSIDVSKADFGGGGTAAGSAQGDSKKSAGAAFDTPFGKITFAAGQKVDPGIPGAIAAYNKAADLYKNFSPKVLHFTDEYKKIGPFKEIEAEIKKTVGGDRTLRLEAGYAQTVKRDIENMGQTFRLLVELADNAARNLKVAETELEAAKDRDEADALMKQVEREKARVSVLVKLISTAVTTAEAAASSTLSGPTGTAFNFVDQISEAFTNTGPLIQEAQELESKARQLTARAAADRFKDTGQFLSTLQRHLADLKPKLARLKTDYDRALKSMHDDFDAHNAKNKGRFNFTAITALVAEAKTIQALGAETQKATSSARAYAQAFLRVRKDWMGNPAEDTRVLQQMFKTADWMLANVEKRQQEMDTMHASLQETYAKAMQVAGP